VHLTTFLPGGQVTVEGPYYDTKNSVLAITGGTGAYSTARGRMELNSRNGGTEYDFIFYVSH
jgi:allene oxide cyclase